MKVREGKEKMGEEGRGSGWFSWRMKKGKRERVIKERDSVKGNERDGFIGLG